MSPHGGCAFAITREAYSGPFRMRKSFRKQKQMIQDEDKIDCIDCIALALIRGSDWRDKVAIRHPSDRRNARASDTLRTLATDISQLSDADWQLIKPHYSFASEPFREAVGVAVRAVGFTHKIQDVSSFIAHLLKVLLQPTIAA
jgi:hypothetical protein